MTPNIAPDKGPRLSPLFRDLSRIFACSKAPLESIVINELSCGLRLFINSKCDFTLSTAVNFPSRNNLACSASDKRFVDSITIFSINS